MAIEYQQPARLYDPLEVTLVPIDIGRSRLVAAQDVLRDGDRLVRAQVTLACLSHSSWRPVRIPPAVAQRMEASG